MRNQLAISKIIFGIFILVIICCSIAGSLTAKAETIVTDEQSFNNAMNSTETVIVVANDITLTREYQITRDLTIKSTAGVTITWGGAAYKKIFTVSANAHFAFENIILDGNGMAVILVKVYGATFTMNEEAVLKNVLGSSAGKAVLIGDASEPDTGGTFNMNGGLITGVSVDSPVLSYYGTINMSGNSLISDNNAHAIGMITSTLNMTGNSAITNNITPRTGAGVLAGYGSIINMGLHEGDTPSISGNTSTSNYGGGLYLVESELNMGFGASISGNTAETMGGGVALNKTILNMSGIAKVNGNITHQGVGGGIIVANGSIVNLSDNAAVFGNSVMAEDGRGGGIFLKDASSLLTISENAKVYDNKSAFGAGVFLQDETEMQMSGGAINTNVADLDGGGVYSHGNITISNGAVDGNRTVSGNGGGIYVASEGNAVISGSAITNNNALNGYGGGIYSEISEDYSNLSTDIRAWFYGNRASVAYTPPENALELYPNIRFASPSIGEHTLNNYDINFTATEILMFNVTYDSNGGKGHYSGPDITPSHTVMILSPEETGITRPNHTFKGWNTAPDGRGQSYEPNETLVINNNVTLYAQWTFDFAWLLWLIALVMVLTIIMMFWFCSVKHRCCRTDGLR